MIYTFFGSRNCPLTVRGEIATIIEEVIKHKGADRFYVGNNGNFDTLVCSVLTDMKIKYPYIEFYVVLAYIPYKREVFSCVDYAYTILPSGIESVPKRYAITYRNKWMIEKSDGVIGYVVNNSGYSSRFFESAKRKGKSCINIYK